MLQAFDSSTPPSPQQVADAKAAGIGLWAGYIASKPNVGLDRPWTQEEFDVVRAIGSTPIAYCSGNDNSVQLQVLAAAWNVRLCLDVEGGIRGDGPWVQPFLDQSGAGLYGNAPVHAGRTAAFHVLAAYPNSGNPNATWDASDRPGSPCGWQWIADQSRFGITVDLSWLDDWFGSGGDTDVLSPDAKNGLSTMASLATLGRTTGDDGARASAIADDGSNLNEIVAELLQDPESVEYLAAIAKLKAENAASAAS